MRRGIWVLACCACSLAIVFLFFYKSPPLTLYAAGTLPFVEQVN